MASLESSAYQFKRPASEVRAAIALPGPTIAYVHRMAEDEGFATSPISG